MALAVANPGFYHKGFSFERPPFNNSIYDPLKITEIRAKTAVIANRRAYLGNAKVFYSDGTSRVYSDSVFKSEVGKFDKFKSSGKIDVAIDDGEHIVALAEYADRILQFKQDTLHILNVAQEIEFLEETHKYKGIANPAAFTNTDYGCAWVNNSGCYMYDGKVVKNILDKQQLRRIKSATWDSFITDRAAIGYIPKEKQLLVIGDMGDGTANYFDSGNGGFTGSINGVTDAYLYDMVTDSWTVIKERIVVGNGMSNITTDFDNDLIYWYDVDGNSVKLAKWANIPTATTVVSNNIILETKDFDFGDAGRDTFIYKIIIQYTGGPDLNSVEQDLTVKYRTNGTGSYASFSTTKLDSDSTAAQTLELKPSATIKNVKSIQIQISGTAAIGFELNDMTIIYREKSIG